MSRALLFAFDRDPLVDFSEVFFRKSRGKMADRK
jgi:hypothetical protein